MSDSYRVALDDQNLLDYRLNPWDERAFGLKTGEITNIQYSNPDSARKLVSAFLESANKEGIEFTCIRIPAGDGSLVSILQEERFYFAETSLDLLHSKVNRFDFTAVYRDDVPLTTPTKGDLHQIRDIAQNSFHFGRFMEDPRLPEDRSRQRYANWIDDLSAGPAEILVYRAGSDVVSFAAFEVSESEARLLLVGTRDPFGYMSPKFWSSIMVHLKNRSTRRVRAMVSAANVSTLNLYVSLGFQVERTLFGFHRFLESKERSPS